MQLKKGSTGEYVEQLQALLGITVDGDFGPKTEQAVKEYQKENGLEVDGIVGPDSWSKINKVKNKYTLQQIYDAIQHKGYKWFNSEDYDVNIIGIRNSSTEDRVTNHYDDHITISYKLGVDWHTHCWAATTDPGQYWIENPMNSKGGTAILVPAQYRGVYKIDKHNGKYEALCQRNGEVSVYRDGNKDDVYDYNGEKISSGYFGINIHRSSAYKASTYINKYSAGCQVFQDPDDFDEFMEICHKASKIWGNKFTYTLIESSDIEK
tara:strand:+ start:3503 stop:4297 length:795 start_codon:yes stop_codon:yes gene_type:complete